MERNRIEFAIQERYIPARIMKEYRFRYHFGKSKEHVTDLGVLQVPSCSREVEEKFVDAVTKAIFDVLKAGSQKQERKQEDGTNKPNETA